MKSLLELDAYVTGELMGPAADAFEEAMFDAPDDMDVVILDRISQHGAHLVKNGTFDVGVTKAHVEWLRQQGRIVQVSEFGPPGKGEVTIQRDAEFLVTVLPVGTTKHAYVDVEVTILKHNSTKTIKDVLVEPDGKVYGLCERSLAEMAFGQESIVRIRENSGARPVIAEWQLVGHLEP